MERPVLHPFIIRRTVFFYFFVFHHHRLVASGHVSPVSHSDRSSDILDLVFAKVVHSTRLAVSSISASNGVTAPRFGAPATQSIWPAGGLDRHGARTRQLRRAASRRAGRGGCGDGWRGRVHRAHRSQPPIIAIVAGIGPLCENLRLTENHTVLLLFVLPNS
jgi:hypothetical protein